MKHLMNWRDVIVQYIYITHIIVISAFVWQNALLLHIYYPTDIEMFIHFKPFFYNQIIVFFPGGSKH